MQSWAYRLITHHLCLVSSQNKVVHSTNCAASAATLLNLINEEAFIACDQAKVTVANVPHVRRLFKYLGIVPNPGMLLGEGIKSVRGSQDCQTMPFSHCHPHKFHKCLREGLPFASSNIAALN